MVYTHKDTTHTNDDLGMVGDFLGFGIYIPEKMMSNGPKLPQMVNAMCVVPLRSPPFFALAV
jgi:hypothetical protein